MTGTRRVLADVAREREHQRSIGYDDAHDDKHAGRDLRLLVGARLNQAGGRDTACTGAEYRYALVQSAALCVAAIERYDRSLPGRAEERAAEDVEQVRGESAVDVQPVTAESFEFCKEPGPYRYTNGTPLPCVLLGVDHLPPHVDRDGHEWYLDPWAPPGPQKVIQTGKRSPDDRREPS